MEEGWKEAFRVFWKEHEHDYSAESIFMAAWQAGWKMCKRVTRRDIIKEQEHHQDIAVALSRALEAIK